MPNHSTLELLQKLIAFPSISSASNLPLIEFVANYLDGLGFQNVVLNNADNTKANLLASIGPQREGGIVFSGHTDVVPVAGQRWSRDPFAMTVLDDRAYGRGSADMKGFIASILCQVATLSPSQLAYPVHIALSYDEEIGCLGVGDMIEYIKQKLPAPAAIIVGEPTEMQVVVGHKGTRVFATQVRGREAHSSMPQLGRSAVMLAAELIEKLRQIEQSFAVKTTGSGFTPPHSTISVNVIKGGKSSNIMAGDCRFEWDVREIPEASAEAIYAEFNTYCQQLIAQHAEFGVTIETSVNARVPPLKIETESHAVQLSSALLNNSTQQLMSIGSEAGLFQEAGYSSVLCGPGSIAQAHRADEFVSLAQLQSCDNFLAAMLASLQN